MVNRNQAGIGSLILLIVSTWFLTLAISGDIWWLKILSTIFIVLYSVGLIIVAYDYYRYG